VIGRTPAAAVVLAALACASPARGHPSPAAPYARARVTQGFEGARRVSLRARWTGFVGVPDPRQTGATVYVSGDPGAASPAVVILPSGGWRARGATYRFLDRATDGRVRATLRAGGRGGRFALDLRDRPDDLVARGTTQLGLTVVMRDVRWCAEVAADGIRETPKRFVATATEPASSCPCEPLPDDSFAAIERRVFARHTCLTPGCHGSAPGQGGLLLSAGTGYGELVSVASTADAAVPRVAPGDPEGSMLWRKLAARTLGVGTVPGTPMPIGDPVVGVSELEAIRQWILAGAPATGAVPEVQALLACDLP
jgi:hypothetical protein